MAAKVYTMDELRGVVGSVAAGYGAPRVGVFGSYARGEATADSDIDLYVVRDGISAPDCFALAYEVEQATGKGVDLATSTSVDRFSPLWREIQRDVVML